MRRIENASRKEWSHLGSDSSCRLIWFPSDIRAQEGKLGKFLNLGCLRLAKSEGQGRKNYIATPLGRHPARISPTLKHRLTCSSCLSYQSPSFAWGVRLPGKDTRRSWWLYYKIMHTKSAFGDLILNVTLKFEQFNCPLTRNEIPQVGSYFFQPLCVKLKS